MTLKNSKQWVVDEVPAKIIREIFQMYLAGKNATQIAEEMARRGYDAPGDYLAKRNQYTKGKSVTFETPKALWHPGTVLNVLDRYEYCGHTVSYRRKSIKAAFVRAANKLVADRNLVLKELREIQRTLTGTDELEAEQKQLAEQMNADADAVQELIAQNARVA